MVERFVRDEEVDSSSLSAPTINSRNTPMASKRIHVYYSGRVQGVGFRFTAEVAARRLKLNGWVSNLTDGRVEVVAEGEEAALKELLAGITEKMSHYISDTEISWEVPTGGFRGFGIKFSE